MYRQLLRMDYSPYHHSWKRDIWKRDMSAGLVLEFANRYLRQELIHGAIKPRAGREVPTVIGTRLVSERSTYLFRRLGRHSLPLPMC